MIRVLNGNATRAPIPSFLAGLSPDSLADLSWTDLALCVQDCAWWPEEDQSPALGEFERYGDETLTVDAERRVVVVTRAVVPWTPEEIAAEQARRRAEQVAAIAARRYAAETAGITVNGLSIDTSRDSQSLITGAALQATLDATYTCRWKTASGFVDLSTQQILALAAAVRAHVQACFDREAVLLGEVEAGTFTADQLEQGWP